MCNCYHYHLLWLSLNNNDDLEVAIAVAVVTGDIQGMSIVWVKSGSRGVVRDDSIKR